ncbi:hypothetical protein SAMN05216266_118103 [Amycolatopsis marina]|uniref:Uncharacterized protein n=1 Tax=Amycolatopsis marina TaxID=490629 RepID=A0A1I1BWY0_9PSEU|nr:hypothetical protein [Amycolatopsis marina]SFB54935.1 hypothetical protein SAMN05216266_118103 [Amycolatopsis marina]
MSTKDTDATASSVEQTASDTELEGDGSKTPTTPPTKSPTPLGNWDPNSPPAN